MSSLLLADRKRLFVLNPWPLLDLLIIPGAIISLLPHITGAPCAMPVLRLSRIPGSQAERQEFMRMLLGQADYLYETVDNLREGLLSVMHKYNNLFKEILH